MVVFQHLAKGQPLQQPEEFKEVIEYSLFQSLYRGTAFATRMKCVKLHQEQLSFNPSTEGQPLQRFGTLADLEFLEKKYPFQSLYRGTAFATAKICQCFENDLNEFQSLYRGTAFATPDHEKICAIHDWVSIPLPRDSLCNRDVAEALISNSYNRLFF